MVRELRIKQCENGFTISEDIEIETDCWRERTIVIEEKDFGPSGDYSLMKDFLSRL